MSRLVLSIAISLLLTWQAALAAEPTAEDVAFFENKIRPVLIKHCYECHAADSKQLGGKLQLDSQAGILRGGEAGPALIAGKADESLIIQALRYDGLEMPPEEPLPESVINDFVKWIERGAADPRTAESLKRAKLAKAASSLWSVQPVEDPELPPVQDTAWAFDPLDRFVLAGIEAAQLRPTSDADARTLIRRLSIDLIGLPPTFEEVEQFAADCQQDRQQSVEYLVDRLLASPQFGERWGRHWLDVARYGESNGNDGLGRNPTFPHAWRYRDYVIAALNADTPYDRFLTEQIAGDLLPSDSPESRDRQLVATGMLAISAKPAKAMNTNFEMDVVADQIDVIGRGVMGIQRRLRALPRSQVRSDSDPRLLRVGRHLHQYRNDVGRRRPRETDRSGDRPACPRSSRRRSCRRRTLSKPS